MPERLTDARIDELEKQLSNLATACLALSSVNSIRSLLEEVRERRAAESVRDDHVYTVHPTYTGPNCAICGLPENRHIARAEKEGKNR